MKERGDDNAPSSARRKTVWATSKTIHAPGRQLLGLAPHAISLAYTTAWLVLAVLVYSTKIFFCDYPVRNATHWVSSHFFHSCVCRHFCCLDGHDGVFLLPSQEANTTSSARHEPAGKCRPFVGNAYAVFAGTKK